MKARMKFKKRVKILTFPVFSHYTVHVEVTNDLKKSLAQYEPTKPAIAGTLDNDDGCAVHIQNMSFVFLAERSSVSTIVHESWHVIQKMFEFFDVCFDHETTAYHLGFLAGEIHRFVHSK